MQDLECNGMDGVVGIPCDPDLSPSISMHCFTQVSTQLLRLAEYQEAAGSNATRPGFVALRLQGNDTRFAADVVQVRESICSLLRG